MDCEGSGGFHRLAGIVSGAQGFAWEQVLLWDRLLRAILRGRTCARSWEYPTR